MATAPPATQGQDGHMHTHALDNLQAMMNLVLISSGRFIKARQAGPDSVRMQFTLKRAVNAANERFQDSLDELENEIFQAQAVLRRDLALHKADRKRREAAAKEKEAEKARLAAESSAKKLVSIKKEELPAATAPTQPEQSASSIQPPDPAPEPPALNRDFDEPPLAAENFTTSAPTDDAPMDMVDTTGGPDTEFDFDALFGDSVMDTSGDDANNQGDIHMDTTGPDLNFSLDESEPPLLPGLEDYTNSGNDNHANTNTDLNMDFPMPDLPDMTGNTQTEQPSTTQPTEQPNDNSTNQQSTVNDDLNMDTITADSLDDLFDLDYQNPEATQFDDAFFGFGES